MPPERFHDDVVRAVAPSWCGWGLIRWEGQGANVTGTFDDTARCDEGGARKGDTVVSLQVRPSREQRLLRDEK